MSEWQTPKTDWSASQEQGVSGADFNRIEGNIELLYDEQSILKRTWTIAGSLTTWQEGGLMQRVLLPEAPPGFKINLVYSGVSVESSPSYGGILVGGVKILNGRSDDQITMPSAQVDFMLPTFDGLDPYTYNPGSSWIAVFRYVPDE